MKKHTRIEILKMAELIRADLIELLHEMGQTKDTQRIAETILKENMTFLQKTLDMPHGGSLSPDELAEMMLAQSVERRGGHYNQEAAATLFHV